MTKSDMEDEDTSTPAIAHEGSFGMPLRAQLLRANNQQKQMSSHYLR